VKANIDNANARGKATEALLTAYVHGKLTHYPAGTRKDAIALFEKARRWFDAQGFTKVESQVVLADEDTGGVADFIFDGMIVDLKCTYDVAETHHLQVGGYIELRRGDGSPYPEGAVLHVTERYAAAKLIRLDPPVVCADFRVLRAAYRVVTRRKGA